MRAAPWVDVTRVEIVVGGKIDRDARRSRRVRSRSARSSATGPTSEARTIRYDADVSVPVGPESTWVVVVVRGDRKMDDVLPFMPVPPLAFTNPIYIKRSALVSPPLPLPEPTTAP